MKTKGSQNTQKPRQIMAKVRPKLKFKHKTWKWKQEHKIWKIKVQTKFSFYYIWKYKHKMKQIRFWCKVILQIHVEQTKGNGVFTFIYTPLET